ncbi:MAG: tetratricopeptide repeat protein [Verrucomicrobiota bacterium]|nr:tetratricopeptide repeat protein [Verrucomicrobiota bacterium]
MKRFLAPLLIALVTFGVYAPVVRDGFVWDDTALILRDPFIRSWRLIPEGFQHFLFTDATASDFFRPIQRLTYTLDYAAFGFRPAGYHLASVAWHAAAAVALFFFATELLRSLGLVGWRLRGIATATSLAWAIHPLQTAAVAYISGRADALAALFGFAGLYCGLRVLRSDRRQRWILYLATGFLFLLSALSKEVGLINLVLWLVIFAAQKQWKAFRAAALVSIFVLVVYATLRAQAEHVPTPPKPPVPALVRPILVARDFAEYTGLVIFPLSLHMDRDVETRAAGSSEASMVAASWRELETLAGILLIAAFVYWLVRERRRGPAVFLLLLLTLVSYLPISGVVALNATIAEHWLYLPSAFLLIAVALTFLRWLESLENRPMLRGSLVVAFGIWFVFLGARTFARTFDWKDQRTFLERTISSGGNSARMLINMAGLELSEGRLDAAKQHLNEALRKQPEQPLAIVNLAAVAVKQNDFPAAHELLKRAVQMPLVEAQADELLAVLESKETGHANVMRMHLAARSGPVNWSIEKRYVMLLDETGATDAGIHELQAILVNEWYRADSWKLLSELLAKSGRLADAEEALAKARAYDVHCDETPVRP